MNPDKNLSALIITCSLKASPAESSSELIATQISKEMAPMGVDTAIIRAADFNIMPGVEVDMGEGDSWPHIREQMLQADIFILATPIWVGHPSSMAQRVIERLDAELSYTDDHGRMETYGKVAAVAVVGNEDGAHKVTADVFQALNDVGFTIPAAASAYWVGEALHKTDYKDLEKTPDVTASAIKSLATNVVHLARLLKENPYPPAR